MTSKPVEVQVICKFAIVLLQYLWLLFQHDSGLKSESNESFNFIKKSDTRWLWVSVHHSYRIQFSLWPTVQGYFLFFIFSLLFFKFTNHVTSINDVVMKWFINLLLPLFYDIFRLIDEISGSQNVELVTQYKPIKYKRVASKS